MDDCPESRVNDAVRAVESHWQGIVATLQADLAMKTQAIIALETQVYMQSEEIKRLEAFAGKELI